MSQQTWTPNPGVPGLADFGVEGAKCQIWGVAFWVKKVPISTIYRGCVGGRPVTKLRGCPLPEAGAQHYRAGGEPETIFSDIQ